MKFKAVITDGAPPAILVALESPDFVSACLYDVAGEILGAENPSEKPAEYYFQKADRTVMVKDGFYGVEFRLSGVTRNGRCPEQLQEALVKLHGLARAAIALALKPGQRVQLFCVLMLDGDIETSPKSGIYSNCIESKAEWIEKPAEESKE